MSRRALAAVCTVWSIALAQAVSAHAAPPPPPPPPAQDSVVGSGTFGFFPPGSSCCFPFQIDVRSGPSGEAPSGQATFLVSFGSPSCLAVDGRLGPGTQRAAMNLLNPITGQRVVVQIDESEGFTLINFFTAASSSDCAFRPAVPAQGAVSTGRIVITDAPPSPTSASQCKDGGWRSFPGFKNQGDCVSFVASAGRAPPSRGEPAG
jgi:hypothetical protein